jgi:56kDa selenium binding protein (SBP56)
VREWRYGSRTRPDAIAVVDVDPSSAGYGRVVGWTDLPYTGDELHHFGWNACSSALCPTAAHPHVERRYLIVPGLRSSRIHVLDTKENPRAPKVVKVLGPEELAKHAGYSRPHTVHCGPDGIYLSALGSGRVSGAGGNSADGAEGPGGIAVLDHDTFEVRPFLMSSAHGAGLMLLPVLVVGAGSAHHHSFGPRSLGAADGALGGLAAVGLHTVAMFLTAGTVALLVFHVFGVGVLRRAWFNLDRMWAAVLIAAGLATVIQAA